MILNIVQLHVMNITWIGMQETFIMFLIQDLLIKQYKFFLQIKINELCNT